MCSEFRYAEMRPLMMKYVYICERDLNFVVFTCFRVSFEVVKIIDFDKFLQLILRRRMNPSKDN